MTQPFHAAAWPSRRRPAFPAERRHGVIVYLFLIALQFRSLGARLSIVRVSIILSLMIGLSRLYLGVHWFSDVATGFALAGLWLVPMLVTAAIYRHRHPATALDGRDRRIPLHTSPHSQLGWPS